MCVGLHVVSDPGLHTRHDAGRVARSIADGLAGLGQPCFLFGSASQGNLSLAHVSPSIGLQGAGGGRAGIAACLAIVLCYRRN